MSTVCAVPRCPLPAKTRGRCAVHHLSEEQRGYGAAHRRDRAAARPGARCENCGCNGLLQRDHRVPRSLGGGEEPSNKRWLCRCPEHGCHDKVGVRRDRVQGCTVRDRGIGKLEPMGASDTRAPFRTPITDVEPRLTVVD